MDMVLSMNKIYQNHACFNIILVNSLYKQSGQFITVLNCKTGPAVIHSHTPNPSLEPPIFQKCLPEALAQPPAPFPGSPVPA